MDYEIRWSPEAIEDVEEIVRYIKKDSPQYAQAVADDIIAASRSLGQFALRGRKVPELKDNACRELFIYSYRLIYRVQDRTILIIAVIHGRRLLQRIEDRFES